MVTDSPAPDELADEHDELDWSWDDLTGGERDELTDDEVALVVLFAGVPEKEVASHEKKLKKLLGGGR